MDDRIKKELHDHVLADIPLSRMSPRQLELWLSHCMVKCVEEAGKNGNVIYRTIWLSDQQAIHWEYTIMTLREKFDRPGEGPRERFLVCAGRDIEAAKRLASKITTCYMYQWDVEGEFYWISFNDDLAAIQFIQLQETQNV